MHAYRVGMAEFEIAVTRRGARMLMRVDARDAAEARTLVAKAMGDGVVFEAAPVRGSAGATASALRPTGLPFLLQASAAGMAAVLMAELAALAETEERVASQREPAGVCT